MKQFINQLLADSKQLQRVLLDCSQVEDPTMINTGLKVAERLLDNMSVMIDGVEDPTNRCCASSIKVKIRTGDDTLTLTKSYKDDNWRIKSELPETLERFSCAPALNKALDHLDAFLPDEIPFE